MSDNIINYDVFLGYNHRAWTFSSNIEDKFEIWSKRLTRRTNHFREELIQAATELTIKGYGPFYVLYSGGYDSEAILNAFFSAGLDAVPVMVRYSNGSNAEEFERGLSYLAEHEHSPIVVDIDLQAWIHSSECREVAEKVQAADLATTAIYKAVLDLPQIHNGFLIMGLHEPAVYAQDSNKGREWVILEEEKWYAHHKFLIAYGLKGLGAFIHYSPELYTSFLTNNAYKRVYANLYNPEMWQVEWVKRELFTKELGLAPRAKRTGFEAIQGDTNKANYQWIQEHKGLWDRHCLIPVLDWIRGVGA